jgi:hypothetical protein
MCYMACCTVFLSQIRHQYLSNGSHVILESILYCLTLAYLRYTLDINLTDEQVNHPLMREAEGIIAGISASFQLRAPISLIPL